MLPLFVLVKFNNFFFYEIEVYAPLGAIDHKKDRMFFLLSVNARALSLSVLGQIPCYKFVKASLLEFFYFSTSRDFLFLKTFNSSKVSIPQDF